MFGRGSGRVGFEVAWRGVGVAALLALVACHPGGGEKGKDDPNKVNAAAEELAPKAVRLQAIARDARSAPAPVRLPDRKDFSPSRIDMIHVAYLERGFGDGPLDVASKDGEFDMHRARGEPPRWLAGAHTVLHRGDGKGKLAELTKLKNLKLLAVIAPGKVNEPILHDMKFRDGSFEGNVFVYDVENGENLGGAHFKAMNSDTIDFMESKHQSKTVVERVKQTVLTRDFTFNIEQNARLSLGAPAKETNKRATAPAPKKK